MRDQGTFSARVLHSRDAVAMVLDDGEYDCVIVDATDDDVGRHLELAITSGALKGDVVRVLARGMRRDALGLLGLPARITVRDGVPSVSLR